MSTLPINIIAELCLGLTLGGMIFFASIIAPTAFKVLSKKHASQFLENIFPRYYVYFIILTGLASAILSFTDKTAAMVMMIICGGFYLARQFLLPRINAAKKALDKGVDGAVSKFSMYHRMAVGMNLLFMLATFMVFLRIAAQ